nr:DmsC/YnfH family molybdoenzyme membrane anchor subunit [uncultured Bacillus sp.]
MGEYEIPLVIFTVLSQWAVGITIAVVLLEWLRPRFMDTTGKQVMKKPIFMAIGISIIGTLASLFHLNNPFKSYTSLIGTGHSWLSREIIMVILFNLCLLALTYLWWKKADHTSIRKIAGTLTAILGIIMIISSAAVYFSIHLHPSWNNWTTFVNFLLTGLLIGALTVSYFALKRKQEESDENVMKLLGIYLSVLLISLVVTLGSSAIMSNGAESQIAATVSFTSIFYWIRVLGSLLVPASLVVYMVTSKKRIAIDYILVATVLVFIGELSGRMLFYYSVMSQYPWF